MSRDSVILAGRRFNEQLMVDGCTVSAFKLDVDPDTAATIVTMIGDPHYVGLCRIKSDSSAVSEINPGGQPIAAQNLVWCVPIGTAGDVKVDDAIRITTVDPVTGDQSRIGNVYRVKGLYDSTYVTEHRFPIEVLN